MRFFNTTLVCLLLAVSHLSYANNNNQRQAAIEAFASQNYAEAKTGFLKLAQEGDAISQFAIAKMYRSGLGVEMDYLQAVYWYEKAASHSYGVAQSHLGEMYENGLGVDRDLSIAKSWYQIACSNRCSEGCQNLERLLSEQMN